MSGIDMSKYVYLPTLRDMIRRAADSAEEYGDFMDPAANRVWCVAVRRFKHELLAELKPSRSR